MDHRYPDEHMDDSSQEETQKNTQTQVVDDSQEDSQSDETIRTRYWGYLVPYVKGKERVFLDRQQKQYRVGRAKGSDVLLKGPKVSNIHCDIVWDGKESKDAMVTVHDMSSNGTYVNGTRVGKGRAALLRDGNELALGSKDPPGAGEDEANDFRYMFRLTTGPKSVGLHAAYDVAHQLGKGSFAAVHSAVHRGSGQIYAIKIIKLDLCKMNGMSSEELAEDGTQKNPFQREIDVMETLNHINICKMKEVFVEPQILAIVLEYISGGDLLDHILKNDGLSEAETKDITFQVCEALSYCHARGITHRDLKPENILITEHVPPIVKVADFGLAKVVDSQTMLKTMCGTPSYLAPEVVSQEGGKGYDSAVDSWSVGVIMYSMLTNGTPFNEPEVQDIRQKILERTIEWSAVDEHQPAFSAPCVDFLKRLLERNPKTRLSLTAALTHRWLAGYVPAYLRTLPASHPLHTNRSASMSASLRSITSSVPADLSMANATTPTNGDRGPILPAPSQDSAASSTGTSHIPGAYPKKNSGPRRQGSQLVRRADVLARAEEDNNIPSPPLAMVEEEERRRAGRPLSGPSDIEMEAADAMVGYKRQRGGSNNSSPRKRRSPRDQGPMDEVEDEPPRRATRSRKA